MLLMNSCIEIGKKHLEENNMTTEEMKLKKFETIVKNADELFQGTYEDLKSNPIELFLNADGNEYYKVILQNSYINKRWCGRKNSNLECSSVDKVIAASKYCNAQCKVGSRKCNIKYSLIYWLLMAIAVDDEKYNTSLSVVTDAAYILGYSEDMMEDWINAVKATLLGKKTSKIEYKTEDAQYVFGSNGFWI